MADFLRFKFVVCKLHFVSYYWVSDIYDIVLNGLGFNVDNHDKHGAVSLVSSHDAAHSKRTGQKKHQAF